MAAVLGTSNPRMRGKKEHMDSLSAREAIPMDEETARDIQGYLVGLVKRWSVGNGPYPLNEKNREKLHAKLLHVAIKACERHDPRKAPLVPYVKAMSARSAKQLAARIYWAQCKLGESREGDLSLDEQAFTSDAEGDSFLDFIADIFAVPMTERTERIGKYAEIFSLSGGDELDGSVELPDKGTVYVIVESPEQSKNGAFEFRIDG